MTLRNSRNLFQPQSVAIFGASGREGRPGYDIISCLTLLGSRPRIYPVTPRYSEILGYSCLADADALPEKVDLAIIASGAPRILDDCAAALGAGAKALHILGDLPLDDCERLKESVTSANADLLGPNSIGYINYRQHFQSSWIAPPESQRTSGNITLIVQSGALFSYANEIDPRLKFAFTIHPGRETGVTLSDALNYGLALPSTRVVGLYLETVTDPDGFLEALRLAQSRDIPVVVVSPGQSTAAAEAIATHARRLAGGTAALESVFRRYGVIHTKSLDEFWCSLHAFSAGFVLGPGGVAVVTDSGAQRAMTLDAASAAGVALAKFCSETEAKLETILAADLEPRNPLDIWAGEEDLEGHTAVCLETALQDPNTAIGVILSDFGVPEMDTFPTRLANGALRTAGGEKPVVAVNFATRHFYPERILELEDRGLIVLDGLEVSLKAIGHLLAFRDRKRRSPPAPQDTSLHHKIAEALRQLRPLDEDSALTVLDAAGIAVMNRRVIGSQSEALAAAEQMRRPLVLKTAEPLLHKTEVRGVHLDLRSNDDIANAYADLAARLGPRVVVASMERGRCELALGALVDPHFGPLVMVGAGGETAELQNDRRFALAPVSEDEALEMLASLRLSPNLDSYRGKPPIDRTAIAKCIVALSRLIAVFADEICEIDVNPLIVNVDRSVAVDAVIIRKQVRHRDG